jgi:activator of HSP90 ATPase
MIHQIVHFSVSPHTVYTALMDEKIHSAFTQASTHIENHVGGTFSVWDGYATGTILELIPDTKIIQSWRASDWDDSATSTVTFIFTPDEKGTKLTFHHNGVPLEFEADIAGGWEHYYWKPMQAYFAQQA